MEDEGDEGDGGRVVGLVAGDVVKVEDGDEDDMDVGGSADAEGGVAMVGEDREDPEVVGSVVGRLGGESAGEDEPPKTQTSLSVPRGI